MFEIRAEVDTGLLADIRQRLDSPRLLLDVAGDALIDYERQAFASRGFGAWATNDPDTIAEKGSGRVLVDTGAVLRDLTSRSSLRFTDDTVTLATQQLGAIMAKRGARGAPKRNPAPKPDSQHVEQWAERILGALISGRR